MRHPSFVIRGSSLRRLLYSTAALLLCCARLLADTQTYTAQAPAIAQIDSITVAGTWAAADTASITIGNSTLTITMGAGTVTTITVADAIKRAINATSLDNNLVSDETRNAAGQLLGEFRDVEAVIDPANTSKVLVRSVVAGVPFGVAAGGGPITAMTATEVTAGSGTVTRASVQAASGPWHWDNVKNWDTAAAPVTDDVVVFTGTSKGPRYALPNAPTTPLEVTFNVYKTFTGDIGLPLLNANGYTEYRQRFARLDDAGASANVLHRFGLGQSGAGSPLINIKHSVVKCSPIVFGSGTAAAGTFAVNICCTGSTPTPSTLNVLGGSVDYSSQDGGTSAFATVTQTAGSSRGILALVAAADVNISGGTATIGGTTALDTIQARGGTLRFENQTGTITALQAMTGGTVEYASTATITALAVLGGTFDARTDAGGFTATGISVYQGSKFYDPYQRMTIGGTGFKLYFEPSPDLQFGATESDPLGITN